MELSVIAKILWAKPPHEIEGEYLPLYVHMYDCAKVAEKLWDFWIPDGTKNIIYKSVEKAKELFVFIAAAHDLGKATPAFQFGRGRCLQSLEYIKSSIIDNGLNGSKSIRDVSTYSHAFASYIILAKNKVPKGIAEIAGGHHGKPPSYGQLELMQSSSYNTGVCDEDWTAVQKELINYAMQLSGFKLESDPDVTARIILTGLIIMTDWIASDENRFPYVAATETINLDRINVAWENLDITNPWNADIDNIIKFDLYQERFNIDNPYPIQKVFEGITAKIEDPGIMIIEAPMGDGKTEAALVAAEIIAAKTGRNGVFFALPTQATSDGIFPRIKNWIEKIEVTGQSHSIILAHGKSRLNEEYQGLIKKIKTSSNCDEDEAIVVHEWFHGRKKGILADFVVGTVDQILIGGLKVKHLAMRHLGIANKVIIIDECHAYDAYMSSYLYKILQWLGAYHTPVIILSATLPTKTRVNLMEAYLNKNFSIKTQSPIFTSAAENNELAEWTISRKYPLITYSDGDKVEQETADQSGRSIEISIERIEMNQILEKTENLLSDGGCLGIIVNTVKCAQEIGKNLCKQFGNDIVYILHSQFLSAERIKKEKKIRDLLGKNSSNRPQKLIVVATQVLEQSIDVDFDVLFTDICPMDMLLQRMGRLHRHGRTRPEKLRVAKCFITGITKEGFESGTEAIYGKYLLMNTEFLLPSSIALPDDISCLVQNTYDFDSINIDSPEYENAKTYHEKNLKDKESRASRFQIKKVLDCKTVIGWLDTDIADDSSGHSAAASVRDSADSIEVILIKKSDDGNFYMMSQTEDYRNTIISDSIICESLAFAVSMCTIKLPYIFNTISNIDKVIRALECSNLKLIPDDWQKSHFLKDELFLVLDEELSVKLLGYTLIYDNRYGLQIVKKEELCE